MCEDVLQIPNALGLRKGHQIVQRGPCVFGEVNVGRSSVVLKARLLGDERVQDIDAVRGEVVVCGGLFVGDEVVVHAIGQVLVALPHEMVQGLLFVFDQENVAHPVLLPLRFECGKREIVAV